MTGFSAEPSGIIDAKTRETTLYPIDVTGLSVLDTASIRQVIIFFRYYSAVNH